MYQQYQQLLLLVLGLSLALGLSPEFGVQLHSFNDLRSLPQAFSKIAPQPSGVLLKLDPQYLTPSLCALQERAPLNLTLGCLFFNHDDVTPHSRTTLNSTGDLLAWLAAPSNAVYTQSSASPLVLSFCFKGCGGKSCPCDGSAGSTAWLSLVDEFLAQLQAATSAPGYNVRLVLDGAGNPGSAPCLAQRWRPLESVFISGDDSADAFTSNASAQGYDRLLTLNQPADLWELTASLKFGKFSAVSRPYVVWEPSDAAGQVSIAHTYLGAAMPPHEPGMLWAINTDPGQWAVNVAQLGARGVNLVLAPPAPPPSPPRHPNVATALLSASSGSSSAAQRLALSTWWSGRQLYYTLQAVAGNTTWGGQGSVQPLQPPAALPLGGHNVSSVGADTGLSLLTLPAPASTLALVELKEGTLVYAVQAGAGSAALSPSPAFVPSAQGGSSPAYAAMATAHAAASSSDGSPFIARLTAFTPAQADPSCALYAGLSVFNSSSSSALPTTLCIALPSPLLSAGITSLSISGALYSSSAPAGTLLALAVSYASGGTVFAATACSPLPATPGSSWPQAAAILLNSPLQCFAASGSDARITSPHSAWAYPPGTAAPLPAFPGSSGKVSVFPTAAAEGGGSLGGGLGVLLAVGGSDCPNSEPRNKNDRVALCELQLSPPPGGSPYLSYLTGTLQHLGVVLQGGESGPAVGRHCSQLVAAGSVGMGGAPGVAGWYSEARQGGEVLVVYEGVDTGSDPNQCGASAGGEAGAVKLISWPLPQRLYQ